MRAFVFLLILSNLLFLAWTQGFLGLSSDPDALRFQQQLQPDRVRVVSRDVPPGAPEKVSQAAKPVEKAAIEMCSRLVDLPLAELDRIVAALAEKLPAFKSARSAVAGGGSHWVFIPPLDNKQEADKKAAELKKLGIPEFFILQDNGPNRFAISLGIFSSKTAAEDRLAQLRKKGVKSAKVGERSSRTSTATLEISGPEAQADALQRLLADVLPESRPAACKSPVAAE